MGTCGSDYSTVKCCYLPVCVGSPLSSQYFVIDCRLFCLYITHFWVILINYILADNTLFIRTVKQEVAGSSHGYVTTFDLAHWLGLYQVLQPLSLLSTSLYFLSQQNSCVPSAYLLILTVSSHTLLKERCKFIQLSCHQLWCDFTPDKG